MSIGTKFDIILFLIRDEELEERAHYKFKHPILRNRLQIDNNSYYLIVCSKHKIMCAQWLSADHKISNFKRHIRDKNLVDIAFVETDIERFLLLIAGDTTGVSYERGLYNLDSSTNQIIDWKNLEHGLKMQANVLDISQKHGWILVLSIESDMTLIRGIQAPSNALDRRGVGNYLENNYGGSGILLNATSNSVEGAITYNKYPEFGLFEYYEDGQKKESQAWQESTYQEDEDEDFINILAARENLAIQTYHNTRIKLWYLNDLEGNEMSSSDSSGTELEESSSLFSESETEKIKLDFKCDCGKKYILSRCERDH